MFFIIQWFRWRKWKKMAAEAIKNCLTAPCGVCFDHIVPGDFVGIGEWGQLVHAGNHFTLTEQNAFCETGGIGIGYWNGELVNRIRESAVGKVFSTGKKQVGEY